MATWGRLLDQFFRMILANLDIFGFGMSRAIGQSKTTVNFALVSMSFLEEGILKFPFHCCQGFREMNSFVTTTFQTS